MMRRTNIVALAGLFVLALAASTAPVAAQNIKLGYIDSQQILQEAPGAAEARQQLQQELSQMQAEVQQMGEELQQAMERFEQQQLTLSDQARQTRQEELLQQQQQYQQRLQQLEQQAAQRQQELVAPVMNRVNTVIEQIRREGNYTMVFDAAAQGIVAADPGFDLTPEVIRRLREQETAGGTTPDTSGGSGDQ
ncbi:MAG: OmpH family outer membrane protein [Longimicrobiales bacterium]|nr:OmpH family outer membrane protein [Longimicrobiales bacterium]